MESAASKKLYMHDLLSLGHQICNAFIPPHNQLNLARRGFLVSAYSNMKGR